MGELKPCGDCGMMCEPGEFHPWAACRMLDACKNGKQVRENLVFVVKFHPERATPPEPESGDGESSYREREKAALLAHYPPKPQEGEVGEPDPVALMTVKEDGTRTYRDHPPYVLDPDIDPGTYWLYLETSPPTERELSEKLPTSSDKEAELRWEAVREEHNKRVMRRNRPSRSAPKEAEPEGGER